jgi:hypothetical protein
VVLRAFASVPTALTCSRSPEPATAEGGSGVAAAREARGCIRQPDGIARSRAEHRTGRGDRELASGELIGDQAGHCARSRPSRSRRRWPRQRQRRRRGHRQPRHRRRPAFASGEALADTVIVPVPTFARAPAPIRAVTLVVSLALASAPEPAASRPPAPATAAAWAAPVLVAPMVSPVPVRLEPPAYFASTSLSALLDASEMPRGQAARHRRAEGVRAAGLAVAGIDAGRAGYHQRAAERRLDLVVERPLRDRGAGRGGERSPLRHAPRPWPPRPCRRSSWPSRRWSRCSR